MAIDVDRTTTSERILDAARELILEQHPAALTVAEIAVKAGVSERTVYRYFPTKDALIAAVAERPTAMAGIAMPRRWNEVRGALRVHWAMFGDNLDMLRSERLIPEGLELRKVRLERSRPGFDDLLEDAGVTAGPERDRLRELLIHLTSSTTLLELVDRHGMAVDDATDLALDAADALVEAARRTPIGGS